MKNKICLFLALLLSACLLAGCAKEPVVEKNQLIRNEDTSMQVGFEASADRTVAVALGQYEGLPLFKKLSMFTIGTDKLSTVNRDARYLGDLRTPTMRYPMSLWTEEDDEKMYEFWAAESYENAGDIFLKNGVQAMYWHIAEVPAAYNYDYPNRDPNRDVRYYPPKTDVYARAWGAVAKKVREMGERAYFEVLNECDHNGWWYGTWDDYIDVYNATAKGIRAGDPDAEVGGLSAGGITRTLGVDKLRDFLTSVEENATPIDFVSYHDYFQVYRTDTELLAQELEKSEYFNSTQMHLNEFNVYWRDDFWTSEKTDTFMYTPKMLPLMFDAFDWLSNAPYVTMAHWGCFTDVGEGFGLFTAEGEPLPSYYAVKIYQNMPVDRVKSTSSDGEVKIIASREDGRAGIVVYNTGTADKQVRLGIDGNDIAGGKLQAYRLDADNANVWENEQSRPFTPVVEYANVQADALTVSFDLPVNGAVYLELANAEGGELYRTMENDPFTLIRKDFYYEDRLQKTYSEYDDFSAIDYVGMGDNELGVARNSLTLENVADVLQIEVRCKGTPQAESERARLGMRVDYRSREGEYTKSVMYVHEAFADFRFDSFPYGTGRAPDEVIAFTDTVTAQIRAKAPADWDGRIILTFEAVDAGKGTEAKFYL